MRKSAAGSVSARAPGSPPSPSWALATAREAERSPSPKRSASASRREGGTGGLQCFGAWLDSAPMPVDIENSIRAFSSWAIGRWDVIKGLFNDKEHGHAVYKSKDKIYLNDFAKFLLEQGFQGNVNRIYSEIQQSGPTSLATRGVKHVDMPEDDGITIGQLAQFEKKLKMQG